jgi:hypothetical protein
MGRNNSKLSLASHLVSAEKPNLDNKLTKTQKKTNNFQTNSQNLEE